MKSVNPMVPSSIEKDTIKSNQTAAARDAKIAFRRLSPDGVINESCEPATATLAQPTAWNNVHHPSPMKKFEIMATSTAKAAPRRAPNCAPTSNAATVTGCTFGNGCITTRSRVTDRTRVAKNRESMIGRFVGFAKSQKALASKATSKTRLANGERVGP